MSEDNEIVEEITEALGEENEASEEIEIEEEEGEEGEPDASLLSPEPKTSKKKKSKKRTAQRRIEDLLRQRGIDRAETDDLRKRVIDLQGKFQERNQNEDKQKFENVVSQLQAQKQQAMADGDNERFNKLDSEVIKLMMDNNTKAQQQAQQPVQSSTNGFDVESYFTSRFPFYDQQSSSYDEKMKAYAEMKHGQMIKDPNFSHYSARDLLDKAGEITLSNFKKNPYLDSVPSDGASIRQTNSSETLKLTNEDLDNTRLMYPLNKYPEMKDINNLKKKAIQLKKSMARQGAING